MSLVREREVAVEAVLKACALCSAVQRRVVAAGPLVKSDRSPVTIADFGSQAVISHLLAEAFPDIPLIGEEEAQSLRSDNDATRSEVVTAVRCHLPDLTEEQILSAIDRGSATGGPSGRYWALDPVDGTKGFLRQQQYAVCLALIEDGAVVLGVLGCPSLYDFPAASDAKVNGCLFWAAKGQGAWTRSLTSSSEQRIVVSGTSDAKDGRVVEPVERGSASQEDTAEVAKLLGITGRVCRMDSQCKYAVVARGEASIYLRLPKPGRKHYAEHIWDHAAGHCITVEAGGRVTDIYGKDIDFSKGRALFANQGIVATNGLLHLDVLAAVANVFAASNDRNNDDAK